MTAALSTAPAAPSLAISDFGAELNGIVSIRELTARLMDSIDGSYKVTSTAGVITLWVNGFELWRSSRPLRSLTELTGVQKALVADLRIAGGPVRLLVRQLLSPYFELDGLVDLGEISFAGCILKVYPKAR